MEQNTIKEILQNWQEETPETIKQTVQSTLKGLPKHRNNLGKIFAIAAACIVFAVIALTILLNVSQTPEKEVAITTPSQSEHDTTKIPESPIPEAYTQRLASVAYQVDDWYYFSNGTDNDKLYKVKTDGSGLAKLCDDNTSWIQVYGEWIYYLNIHEGIFKIRMDGSQKTLLSKKIGQWLQVNDDYVYFCASGANNTYLYRVKTDGSEETLISNDPVNFPNMVGDWIYYSTDYYYDKQTGEQIIIDPIDSPYSSYELEQKTNMKSEIYKMKLDGSEQTKVSDDSGWYLNVTDDWIYYINTSDDWRLYKIRTDGTERTKVSDDFPGNYFLISDGWVYYDDIPNGSYKIKSDGTQKTKISDEAINTVSVQGDWIYYYSDLELYKMRLDGSDSSVVIPFTILPEPDSIPKLDGFTVQGQWVYYISKDSNICKVRPDGSENTVLAEMNKDSLVPNQLPTVNNEWVYYNDGDGFYRKLHRVRIDGQGKFLFLNATGFDYQVNGDWLYYANNVKGNNLYRIKADGTQNQQLNKQQSADILIINDWIYYRNCYDNQSLYKMKLDGSENTKLCEDYGLQPQLNGNFIYYKNQYPWGNICKVDLDGKQKSVVIDSDVAHFAVDGDWIYYTNKRDYANKQDNNNYLYKIKTDGTEKTKVIEKNIDGKISILDGYIYYLSNSTVYRAKLDGSDNTKVVDSLYLLDVAGY